MAANTTTIPLVPIFVTGKSDFNYDQFSSQFTNIDGTLYLVGVGKNSLKGSELYKLDANGIPTLVAEIDPSYKGSHISMITNVKGIIYFNASDSDSSTAPANYGLYRIDPVTSSPVRLGDNIITTSVQDDGVSANIVNIGNSDYFLANNGDKNLWKIDRSSGILSKVNINGLPTNFNFSFDGVKKVSSGGEYRTANDIIAIGDYLYFQGNNKV
jgi:hypothetical protein